MAMPEIGKLPAPAALRPQAQEQAASRPEQWPARPAAPPQPGVAVEQALALDPGQPPVDSQRVEEIRKALREGSYPIVPAKIADATIAARILLSSAE